MTDLTVEDMAPIARGTNDPQILMVNCKTSPYKTPEDFVAGMKNGDALKFGGTSSGTIDHLTVYLWAKRMGQPMPTYLPCGGGGELATQVGRCGRCGTGCLRRPPIRQVICARWLFLVKPYGSDPGKTARNGN